MTKYQVKYWIKKMGLPFNVTFNHKNEALSYAHYIHKNDNENVTVYENDVIILELKQTTFKVKKANT